MDALKVHVYLSDGTVCPVPCGRKRIRRSPATIEILVDGRKGKCKLRLVCGTGYQGTVTVDIVLEFARHLRVDIVDQRLDTIKGTVVSPVLVTIRSLVVIQVGAACKDCRRHT